jgi:hypothetical protein
MTVLAKASSNLPEIKTETLNSTVKMEEKCILDACFAS